MSIFKKNPSKPKTDNVERNISQLVSNAPKRSLTKGYVEGSSVRVTGQRKTNKNGIPYA